jgi:hypothetical protein
VNRTDRSVGNQHQRHQPLDAVVLLPVQPVSQADVGADDQHAASDLPGPAAADERPRQRTIASRDGKRTITTSRNETRPARHRLPVC